MKKICSLFTFGMFFTLVLAVSSASAATVSVTMNKVEAERAGGLGGIVGIIVFEDSARGLKIMPNLKGLSEGRHGFHVHRNPSCAPKEKAGNLVGGLAAGSHFDPKKSGTHLGPHSMGHLGDLPLLYVDAKGMANRTTYAPALKLTGLKGRAIVIHSGGDNYSDIPKKLGGGGSRAACGVVVY